jgi:hypothetical protein
MGGMRGQASPDRERAGGRTRGHDHAGAAAAVDPEDLTYVGDHQVFRDVQPDDTQERPEPEKPDVQGDARHQAQQGHDRELKWGPFHRLILWTPRAASGRAALRPDSVWA